MKNLKDKLADLISNMIYSQDVIDTKEIAEEIIKKFPAIKCDLREVESLVQLFDYDTWERGWTQQEVEDKFINGNRIKIGYTKEDLK